MLLPNPHRKQKQKMGGIMTDTVQQPAYEAENGMALRLLFLTVKYSKPLDFTYDKLEQAQKTLIKWHKVAERGKDMLPPIEFYEALCDDLNTPKAIALMHGYCSKKEGDKLFASMAFLGLIPGVQPQDLTEQEIKTNPTWEVECASFCRLPTEDGRGL